VTPDLQTAAELAAIVTAAVDVARLALEKTFRTPSGAQPVRAPSQCVYPCGIAGGQRITNPMTGRARAKPAAV
jgi:hypothetical protein